MRVFMWALGVCFWCGTAIADETRLSSKVGEWHMICELTAGASEFDCTARQGVEAKGDASRQIFASLRIESDEQAMLYFRFKRPNKVLNPRAYGGVAFSLDGKHGILNLRQEHCNEKECTVPWRVNSHYLVRLSVGKEIEMIVPIDEVSGFSLPISLDGFKEVYLMLVDESERRAFLGREYLKQIQAQQDKK